MSNLEITRGTTNVFADLGYPDATERQTKTRLALAVNELLKSRKLKQREIAILLKPICALSPFLYEFQLLLSVVALIEFYFKLIICITIPEEPYLLIKKGSSSASPVTFCVVFKQFIQTQSIHTVNQATACYSNAKSRIINSNQEIQSL